MRLPRGTREAGLALAAALALIVSAGSPDLGRLWRKIETASLDERFRIRGPLPARPDIALVMVDDASLLRLGRWPFSRHLMARAVDRLTEDGAKAIVFDQLFVEAETPKPANLRDIARRAVEALPKDAAPDLRAQLRQLAEDDADADFAASIGRSGKVLLPFAFSFQAGSDAGASTDADLGDYGYALDRSPIAPEIPMQPRAVLLPIDPLLRAAAGLGYVNILYDLDLAPRYEYLTFPFNGDYVPPMSVRAAAWALDVPLEKIGVALGLRVRIGALLVPTDPAMRMLINYRGPKGTFPSYSFAELLAGTVAPDLLRGRILILGASFVGNPDANAAPFGPAPLPGAERMANAIATMLDRDFIREVPLSYPVEIAILALSALIGAMTARLPTRAAPLAAILPPAAWLVGAQFAFARGWWLPLAVPAACLGVASAVAILFRYWVTDREGRRIKSTFKRYLAPNMVDILAADPSRLKLGGETRQMTLLFCDVRGFTTISEAFAGDPQGLTRLINRFLTPMTDIILAAGGTIDKYMGDCIMAFWNAPLDEDSHADLACRAALEMCAALAELNRSLAAEATATGREFHELRIGIGLNSGACVVGNMGSEQRQDYSVLGDPVNLASRLEGQSKTYGVDIVIGETTRTAAPDWAALELDLIAVKGKREAVRIYGLLGDKESAGSDRFRRLADRHAKMLEHYRARDWAGAMATLEQCEEMEPALSVLYALYRHRIAQHIEAPPPPDWSGVYVAQSK